MQTKKEDNEFNIQVSTFGKLFAIVKITYFATTRNGPRPILKELLQQAQLCSQKLHSCLLFIEFIIC